jgi:hypothetical protein
MERTATRDAVRQALRLRRRTSEREEGGGLAAAPLFSFSSPEPHFPTPEVYGSLECRGACRGRRGGSESDTREHGRAGGAVAKTYMDPTHRDARDIRAGQSNPNVVFVGTRTRLALDTELDLERAVPEGTVSIRVFRKDTGVSIGQFAAMRGSVDRLRDLFDEPRQLGMSCIEEYPGVVGQLLVLLPPVALSELDADGVDPADGEEWRASLDDEPDLGAAGGEGAEDGTDEADQLAALHAGNVVRFAADREHPENLAREAADLLRDALDGPLPRLSDRLIEELAGGALRDE